MAYEIPMISIIVPMYNTERYIRDLLESVLAQTFHKFEIIVVDNGSTDGSLNILRSYLNKFDNRLKIMQIAKNTGNASVPRNKGLGMSRGKYVFFMDSDDVLVNTALEEMYDFAEASQAEVVCCERSYHSTGIGQEFMNNVKVGGFPQPTDRPIFMSEDILPRLQLWIRGLHNAPPWYRLSLRDFLVKNAITFHSVYREDELWSFEVLCSAKKFLRVPNCCYIKRAFTGDNMTTKSRPFEKHVHYWLDNTIRGLKYYYEFMERTPFFKANPHIRDEVIRHVINQDLQLSLNAGVNLSPDVMFDAIKNEFREDIGDHDVLISSLCVNNYLLFNSLMHAQRQLALNTTPPPVQGNRNNK